MRDEILKILNKYIDDKEKSASEFINRYNADKNEILVYFSKVSFISFKLIKN